jgi:outer membrane protein assembly factor BamC
MDMKQINKAVLATTLLATAGCSMLGMETKQVDYKSQAQRNPSLEVPPGLTAPNTEGRYTIPGSEGETVASYSEFAGAAPAVPAPQAGVAASPVRDGRPLGAEPASVAQSSGKVRLEREGARRWLAVNASAESLWPAIKAYWEGQGFKLEKNDPQAGVMETDWKESRAKIEEDGVRGMFAKLSDGMYSLPNRDMFRLRIERIGGDKCEIHIAHYGKEEVVDAGGNTYNWQNRASDVELEAAVLQQLLVKLNGSVAGAAAQSSNVASAELAREVPRVTEQTDGSKVIRIDESFDKVWHRVGLALEQIQQNIEDKNRAEGVYFVNTVKEEQKTLFSFLGGGSGRPERLFVRVRAVAGGCEVAVTADDGSESKESRRLFDKIAQQLK